MLNHGAERLLQPTCIKFPQKVYERFREHHERVLWGEIPFVSKFAFIPVCQYELSGLLNLRHVMACMLCF